MQGPRRMLQWMTALTASVLCLLPVPTLAASQTFVPDAWFQRGTAGSTGSASPTSPGPAQTSSPASTPRPGTQPATAVVGDGWRTLGPSSGSGRSTWGPSGTGGAGGSGATAVTPPPAPAPSGGLPSDGGSYGPGTGSPANIPAQAAEIISWTNATRAQHGMPTLAENSLLDRIALLKCQDMVNNHYFSHQSPTYGSPLQMQQAFGVRARIMGAENIAGARDAARAYFMFVNSPEHLANILYNGLTDIGVAVVPLGVYGVYVCQEFTGN